MIDLTWATPPAALLIESWRVTAELVTLSDHRYVEIKMRANRLEVLQRRRLRERERADGLCPNSTRIAC